ncbi:kinesin heavy chain isoform 5C, putative [Entamoeba invadens IP1]|uniref:kinesin heavy chain isoform 5C, putative n=1 Tax=Entamoeba invadens IP1 TaxID=370355 RepID=UPI0002C3F91B|nr:kinesin heavy chain isoform 5C, putative [Entamoeba invadens IP1]ELP93507.1 kinesin heavy chain isoform 5C, putative [Entamoeba invadens IP1]|eukprot:XP_004260278.1 kinesin heavy chain isoform 5C, putative [Entamoeba invadens IP1]
MNHIFVLLSFEDFQRKLRKNRTMQQIVEVGVRVRPANKNEVTSSCCEVDEKRSVIINNSPREECHFDFVGDEKMTQRSLFERVGVSIVDSCLSGSAATLFAYGQTGSGKTFTVFGDYDHKQQQIHNVGLVPRCLELLFQKKQRNLEVGISMFEVYNDIFFDLMKDGEKCDVKSDLKGTVGVNGLAMVRCTSWEEALTFTVKGYSFRKTSTTKMNDQSSRSHCVTLISVGRGTMIFVDLAGSERVERSGVTGLAKIEAGNINKTLTALGRVIRSLVAHDSHIPFRDCKLTTVLENAMVQSQRICFIATISSSVSNAVETWGTVNFAKNTKQMKIRVVRKTQELTYDELKMENIKLKTENQVLKNELNSRKRADPSPDNFQFHKIMVQTKEMKHMILNNPSVDALTGEKNALSEDLREARNRIKELEIMCEEKDLQIANLLQTEKDFQDQIDEKNEELVGMEECARDTQKRFSVCAMNTSTSGLLL